MCYVKRPVFFFVLSIFLLSVQTGGFFQPLYSETKQAVAHKEIDIEDSLKNIKSNLYKETLDNGLTLLFYHKEHTPEVVLKVMYDVGSKDEESSEYGFAHLVEHMIFKGTKKLSEQAIFEISRKFGAEPNACTSYDKTVYHFYTDNKNWTVFLGILADCMENVSIADEHLASELKTVFDELKMRDADGVGNCFTELFPSNHPYHHPVIGYKENLLNLDPSSVRAFYKKHYRPDRATVIVVGDLDKDDVIREVKTVFGSIPCPQKIIEERKENTQFSYINKDFFQKNIVIYKSIPDTIVSCVWTVPGDQDTKNSLCCSIMGIYLSNKLNDVLYDKKALVSYVRAGATLMLKAGALGISFEPQAQEQQKTSGKNNKKSAQKNNKKSTPKSTQKNIDGTIETCKNIIIKKIEHIITHGIAQDELDSIRRMIKVGLLRNFEKSSSIARNLENSYIINKNEYQIFEELAVLDSIINDDVKAFGRQFLRPTLMNMFTVKPLNIAEKDEWLLLQKKIDEYDTSLLLLKMRSSGLSKDFPVQGLPDPKLLDVVVEKPDAEFDLDNGLHVVVKQRKDVPFIVSEIFFKNAHKLDRFFSEKRKSFIPYLAMGLLQEGSAGYSKQDHRKFFEKLGATCFDGSISCVSSDFDAVAQRHVHILTKPTYLKKAFEKHLKDIIESMEKLPENERFVAKDNLSKYLRQNDFLSKKTLEDDIADVKKYTRAELFDFHGKYLAPRNMVLVIVGDFDHAMLKEQLDRSYGQLKNSAQACDIEKIVVNFPELQNPVAKEQKIYLPKERVVLNAGRITVKREGNDYFGLVFLEQYLNKVLFELREQHGLFYSCACNLVFDSTWEQQGQARISSELSLANIDAVVTLIKTALNNIAKTGISKKDFESARNSIVSSLAKSNITNSDVLHTFVAIKTAGFEWDYSDKRLEKFLNVTCDDVSAIAKKYLNPNDWSFVIVGRVGLPEQIGPKK
ncbi:MAG: pitrilysin family protein [bacterium]